MKKGTPRVRHWWRIVLATGAMFAAAEAIGVVAASANAPNPNPDTTGTYTVNADGSVTANLSGTWTWPNQSCSGRYGEGWAVDWWGVSSSQIPTNNFALTDATEVTSPTTTTTGTITSVGSIPIKGSGPGAGSTYFHVAQYYAGQVINSPSTCTDSGTGPSATSSGSWSASATYPSLSDIPPEVCVNMYDEHGQEGSPSNSANDFSPLNDGDNSIQTNKFDPTSGTGFCVQLQPKTPVPVGTIGGAGLAGLIAIGGGFVMWRHHRRSTGTQTAS